LSAECCCRVRSRSRIGGSVKSAAPASTSVPLSADEAMQLVAGLQSELAGVKAALNAKVSSLEETIANLAQENQLLKRRLFGNKTEQSHTSEMQLALGDLLAAEAQLQKELDAAVAAAKQGAGSEGQRRAAVGLGRRASEAERPARSAGEQAPAPCGRDRGRGGGGAGRATHRLRRQRAADVPARGSWCWSSGSRATSSSRTARQRR
jgi:hypothetical protein